MKNLSDMVFQYGSMKLDKDFLARNEVQYYTRRYGLDVDFPVKHPILQDIAGTFTFAKTFPHWWDSCIYNAPFPMRFFLPSITADEYFAGIVDEKRYKLFRTFLPDDMKKLVPQSPKIGGMLQDNPYLSRFESRGGKGNNHTVYVTTRPEDMFYMSNGDGWNSCQHWAGGGYSERLRGSMFDPCSAMMYVLSDDKTSIEEGATNSSTEHGAIIARALIRLMRLPYDDTPIVFIDKTYGNDGAIQTGMILPMFDRIVEKGYVPAYSGSSNQVVENKYPMTHGYLAGHCSVKPSNWEWSYQDNLSYMYETGVKHGTRNYTLGMMYGNGYYVQQEEKKTSV